MVQARKQVKWKYKVLKAENEMIERKANIWNHNKYKWAKLNNQNSEMLRQSYCRK